MHSYSLYAREDYSRFHDALDHDRPDQQSGLVRKPDCRRASQRTSKDRLASISLYAAIILVVAGIIGQIVLDAMGICLRSFQIAGGLILFVFGLQMVFGWIDQPGAHVEQGRDLAVFPLAMPLCRCRCDHSRDPY
jgi:MarC family integral membrane protein